MLKSKKAFTLIELLVVIAIIGILATVSVIALNNARAKSRDAKRAGDIKQIQTALELFYSDNNRYPTPTEWNTGKIYSTSTDSTSTYMQIIPNAPSPSDGSCTNNQNSVSYSPTFDGSSYTISFCLGNTTGTLTSGPKCLTPGGIIDRDCSCGDAVVDSRDGQSYPTVKIGGQCWMAKNMNVGTMISGATDQTNNSPTPVLEKYCFNDTPSNCDVYGGLYQWDEAMQYVETERAQGICPAGWHIPSDAEQNILDQYLTDTACDPNREVWGCANAGSKLSLSTLNGTNSSGFTGLLAGERILNGSFIHQGLHAHLFSSSISGSNAWFRNLSSGYSAVRRDPNDQAYGLSVRCLQD